MAFTEHGFTGLSHLYHDFYRTNLCHSKFVQRVQRPVLINSWEAAFMDFDDVKLVEIAKAAKNMGVDLLVMDDGWFGARSSDNCALGDWKVNEEKITGGLKCLVDEVNKLGMKFGIWFEPEMISPDSDLYRAHPDWAIAIPGRPGTESRQQFVLDLSRPEVVDCIYEQVASVLRSANIEYVKWDMNRQLTDIGSYGLPADRQGELYHRYVLAVYQMQDRLTKEFPYLLLENCSGGGARFDPGILYYAPQGWASDDSDAIERLKIQYGTSYVYPISSIGSHVSVVPNHQVFRNTPLHTRANVAYFGTFGYELDLNKVTKEEQDLVKEQIADFHRYYSLTHEGDYYRLAGPEERFCAWEFVDREKEHALQTLVMTSAEGNPLPVHTIVKGLDPEKNYICSANGKIHSGRTWMNGGLTLGRILREYESILITWDAV